MAHFSVPKRRNLRLVTASHLRLVGPDERHLDIIDDEWDVEEFDDDERDMPPEFLA